MHNFIRYALIVWFALLVAAHTYADDSAVSQQIRSRIEQQQDTSASAKYLRDLSLPEAVAQFYGYRNYAPAWSKTETVDKLLREIENISGDGLDPEDYHLAALKQQRAQLSAQANDATALANFDLLATEAYLRSLAHLFRGKINPKTLDAQWNFTLNDMAAGTAFPLIDQAVNSGDIAGVYARARPEHPFYKKTRTALATLRQIAASGGWPTLTTSATLKPGMQDAQVIALRQRLAAVGYLPADKSGNDVYDDELATAVQAYQREQYLDPDGAIGPSTRAALNVPVAARIDQMRVNLERGRWLLHELSENAVLVDIAGFRLAYLKNGQPAWQTSVQVGKPYRSTPIFKSEITYITFNPTWTVPPTIFKHDILPKIRRDRGYLARNEMRVLNASGREISPDSVDWSNPGNIILRQDAGPKNPLGQLVVRFPNPYSVYLHDTSHKELFSSSQRAFSSGCIRVENPHKLVELLFNDPQKWSRAAIDQKIAEGKTANVDLPTRVPLLLAYWTVDVPDNQHIIFKPDIYKRDPGVLRALNRRL